MDEMSQSIINLAEMILSQNPQPGRWTAGCCKPADGANESLYDVLQESISGEPAAYETSFDVRV